MIDRSAIEQTRAQADAAQVTGLSWADALALITVVAWGATFPFSKPIVASVQPFVFATARFAMIAIGLMILVALTRQSLRLKISHLFLLTGLGLIFGVLQSGWVFALSLTSASKGAVIMATSPAFGALFGRFMGERSGASTWAGLLIAFVGVFLVINNSLTALRLGHGSLLGDLAFLASSALWALYNALSRGAVVRHGALKAGAYVTLFGTVVMLFPAYYGAQHGPVFPSDPRLWLNFVFVVVVSGILAFAAWYSAIARLGSTRTLIYMYLVPVFAVGGSVLFLDERLSLIQLGGGVLALVGVVLARQSVRGGGSRGLFRFSARSYQ